MLFINIPYKMAKEKAPDAKRRLKWLYWGMTASLGPIFLFILYSWLFQKKISDLPETLIIVCVRPTHAAPAA